MEKEYLNPKEVNNLIRKVQGGDQAAWEKLYENFRKYIHKRAWEKLKNRGGLGGRPAEDIAEELESAGLIGFVDALKHFDTDRGYAFLTYADAYIHGEMSKELDRQLNPLGMKDRPSISYDLEGNASGMVSAVSLDDERHLYGTTTIEADTPGYETSIAHATDDRKFSETRRALQILQVLKYLTDEEHTLSKNELMNKLGLYRQAKYRNASKEAVNTLTGTIEGILQELNPDKYSEDNDEQYRIKYRGYEQDLLSRMPDGKTLKKAPAITDYSYVHDFSNKELDELIQVVSLSDLLAHEEKERLVKKLVGTASLYYKNPFWRDECLAFNPKGVYSRTSHKDNRETSRVAGNISIIQEAINCMGKIKFRFCRYNADHELTPKTDQRYILSPYYLVAYHDNYYCIGYWERSGGSGNISHYRVDLMSDVRIMRDDNGAPVPWKLAEFEGLPIHNSSWNPEKYMAEHMNMAYDAPREILIKIPNDRYTMLHDWFGDYYQKTDQLCEKGYDIVSVTSSPFMMARWAMQYSEYVEVLDEDVREEIKNLMKGLVERYGE